MNSDVFKMSMFKPIKSYNKRRMLFLLLLALSPPLKREYISLCFSERPLSSPYEMANRYYRAYKIISSKDFPDKDIVKMKLKYAGHSKDKYWDEIDIVLLNIRSSYVSDDFKYAGEIRVESKKCNNDTEKLVLNDFYHSYLFEDHDDLIPEYM